MRIALVSPYSWTYPGGVTRHIEALAEQFIADGHDVRVLAPVRSARPRSRRCCTAAPGRSRDRLPDYAGLARPDGRLQGQRRRLEPVDHAARRRDAAARAAHRRLRRRPHPRAGRAADRAGSRPTGRRLPLVGTFHSYSDKRLPNGIANLLGARRVLNHLHVRIAVSEAAAWTGAALLRRPLPRDPERRPRRPRDAPRCGAATPVDDALRIVFVGQAVERKGLPLLLRAFEALREHIPTELTVIGPTARSSSR